MPDHQNYCAIYLIYKRDRGPHNTSRWAALDNADLDFRPMTYGSRWCGKLQPLKENLQVNVAALKSCIIKGAADGILQY